MPNWSPTKPCTNCAKKSGYPMLKCDTCSVKKIVMSSKCCSTVPGAKARETADSLSSGPGGLLPVIPEKNPRHSLSALSLLSSKSQHSIRVSGSADLQPH